ncbi:ketose-bisphosphate aldolase [Mycoplasma enhydrae]|uniref:class II fructose-bisphosphate aldolase n=1 Tax=Mycoplasma enhydrae TaxID=2499220 RepID=UPI0021E9998E|nr:ketose-bisphosphate aldolase [Mycoplasma enhydrae]MCV3733550.1 ketose-bisphosphate aldolase [Mycoplasma enhydrae]MCV3753474.1 ketose-bisphosphate aldolase [Mycoplasma enhydrae]
MLVNAKEMLNNAYKQKKVVFHININNLEWTKQVLLAAQETSKPIILGVSPSAIKYFGGYKVVYNLVVALIENLSIKVPVCLHLDHGNYEDCLQAIEANFSSIMFDGSKLDFEQNLELSKKIIAKARKKDITVECETGTIGNVNDDRISDIVYTKLEEALKFKEIGVDMLAIGIGNVHGEYPKNWNGINFELLSKINENLQIPLVLHGGSGISENDLKKCISLGITKININTDLQIENAKGLLEYIKNNDILKNKNYNPRKLYKLSNEMIFNKTKELLNKY